MGFYFDTDKKPRLIAKIDSIKDTITGLEKAIKVEWAEIKDFVHSYHKTEAATKRIENMKSNIAKLTKELRKLERKLLEL